MWDHDDDEEEIQYEKKGRRHHRGGPTPSSSKTTNRISPDDPDLLSLQKMGVKPSKSQTSHVSAISGKSEDYILSTSDEDEEEDPGEDYDVVWVKNFHVVQWFCIICGRWPLTYRQKRNKRGFKFYFSWACPGFIIFALTFIYTLLSLIISAVNVILILMQDKLIPAGERTPTAIIEQGLVERHTMIVMIVLGSHIVNLVSTFFIFLKRESIATMFKKWTKIVRRNRLACGTWFTYIYVFVAFGNFVLVSALYIVLTCASVTATFIGGPTVVSLLLLRQFCPSNYLEDYSGSFTHWLFTIIGLCVYFHLIITCNAFMYLLLWLLKSIHNGFAQWNARVHTVMEETQEKAADANNETKEEEEKKKKKEGKNKDEEESEKKEEDEKDKKKKKEGKKKEEEENEKKEEENKEDEVEKKEEEKKKKKKVDPEEQEQQRITFPLLYQDHIGLVRMLSWFNNMFAGSLEPYILFLTIRIVYQFYLAALVLSSNGKPLNSDHLGKYFIRNMDYIPALMLLYENVFMLLTILLSSAWLEDTAYDSYEDLRQNALLKGKMSEKESYFYLSMFQSFTSTTPMAVYCADFFCLNRYSILHVLMAVMSNFLVIYQFKPLFDMDTSNDSADSDKTLRKIMGDFLIAFEGLSQNHTLPVSDSVRSDSSA